jgi:hypothetical protein
MTSGGGHGPRFTFAPAMPYGIGLLVFPVLGYLVGDLSSNTSRVVSGILLIAHCAMVISLVVHWVAGRFTLCVSRLGSVALEYFAPSFLVLLWAALYWGSVYSGSFECSTPPCNTRLNADAP